MSGVFQPIDPPPHLPMAIVSSPRTKGGGGGRVHTRRAVRGGVNSSEDARHWIGLYSVIPLRPKHSWHFKSPGSEQSERKRARIFKTFKEPRNQFQGSTPPAYLACWRVVTTNRAVVPARQTGNRFLGSCSQIRAYATLGWRNLLLCYFLNLSCRCYTLSVIFFVLI